ncbi:MAG: efflux RND transporter periplasmic adaptor subunit [Duganella sp.]
MITLDKKSRTTIAIIIVVGAILAAVILFWKKGDGAAESGGHGAHASAKKGHDDDGHGKEGHQEKGAEGKPHGDAELVAMTAQQIKTAGVKLAVADKASIDTIIELPGEIRFNDDRTAHIVPRVPGVAESVSADLGQSVKKGQVLAVISSSDLADLRSAALAAQKRLALAKTTYEREKKLWQDKISAEQDYLQAEQAYREAEIQAQTARSKLSALGAGDGGGALNRYVLRAPFDGIVVEKHIALGEAVAADANVFLLSDLSSVWAEVIVSAKDLEKVSIGKDVTIYSTASKSSAVGKISYVGNLLGEQTRTSKARVVIANPNLAWRPGLFVNVALTRDKKEVAVAVLSEAVQTVEGKTVVFVANAKGFTAQPVTTGASDGKYVEIVQGIAPGATYAATGSFVVKAEQGKGSASHEH